MYQRLTTSLLRWLRVPPEPHPPEGDPSSLRVFRAGRHFLNLRLVKWGFAQIAALAGIMFWFGVFSDLGERVEQQRIQSLRPKPAAPVQAPAAAPASAPTPAPAPAPAQNVVESTVNSMVTEIKSQAEATEKRIKQAGKAKKHFGPVQGYHAWRSVIVNFVAHLPGPALLVIRFIELAGIAFYFVQLPMTLLIARMDFELRWYMVTDRSLRIRHGVWKISESTMSFANIQQVVVTSGPLQRLLGLADVKVQSAGGGGEQEDESDADGTHHGLFHSVTNAGEIRDLILERLRHFRESGLGDPDETAAAFARAEATGAPPVAAELRVAAQELGAEARALRSVRETLTRPKPA